MQRSEVLAELRNYIVNQVLDGKSIGFEETTPLLEWGIINSLEIVRLSSFVQQRFHVAIPGDQMIADNFRDLNSVMEMILSNIRETASE